MNLCAPWYMTWMSSSRAGKSDSMSNVDMIGVIVDMNDILAVVSRETSGGERTFRRQERGTSSNFVAHHGLDPHSHK